MFPRPAKSSFTLSRTFGCRLNPPARRENRPPERPSTLVACSDAVFVWPGTLAVAPETARNALQVIADSKFYPQAGDAGMLLRGLDDGSFHPK